MYLNDTLAIPEDTIPMVECNFCFREKLIQAILSKLKNTDWDWRKLPGHLNTALHCTKAVVKS